MRLSTILLLLGMSHGVAAQCIDSDGDGWGWDGTASCRVTDSATSTTLIPSGSVCVDSDGDGWGWDGTTSCRVVDTANNTGIVPVNSNPVENSGVASGCDYTDAAQYDGWGWNASTAQSCAPLGADGFRLDLSGSIEDLLARFSVNKSVPRLETLLGVPLVCRKIRNSGYDDGFGFFDDLSRDENVIYSGTLRYLGDSLRHSSQAPAVQSEYKFHEVAEAALSFGSMWQSLDDEPIAEFHDSAPRFVIGPYIRQQIASMSFTGDARSGYLFREYRNSLLGTSQAFQTSVCVLR